LKRQALVGYGLIVPSMLPVLVSKTKILSGPAEEGPVTIITRGSLVSASLIMWSFCRFKKISPKDFFSLSFKNTLGAEEVFVKSCQLGSKNFFAKPKTSKLNPIKIRMPRNITMNLMLCILIISRMFSYTNASIRCFLDMIATYGVQFCYLSHE